MSLPRFEPDSYGYPPHRAGSGTSRRASRRPRVDRRSAAANPAGQLVLSSVISTNGASRFSRPINRVACLLVTRCASAPRTSLMSASSGVRRRRRLSWPHPLQRPRPARLCFGSASVMRRTLSSSWRHPQLRRIATHTVIPSGTRKDLPAREARSFARPLRITPFLRALPDKRCKPRSRTPKTRAGEDTFLTAT